MNSLLHIALLVAATFGTWLLRPRPLAVVACLLIFPLPAALFQLYVMPSPVVNITDRTDASTGGCIRQPSPQAEAAAAGKEDNPGEKAGSNEPRGDCPPPRGESQKQTFFVVILVNYLTVLIGFLAGLLAHRASARRQETAPR